jgi:hypothetical protein
MERIGQLGYLGLVRETTKGVAVIPTDYVPLYKESMTTDLNMLDITPAMGNKFKRQILAAGQRSHKGSFEVMGEPNTAAKFFDMLLTLGSVTGADPYTYPFTLDATTNPKSYTVDISTGNQVFRFFGLEAHEISPAWNSNEMRLNIAASALGSFSTREIATITPGATNTITFTTTYDSVPNKGLVVGDLIAVTKADGTNINCTILSVNVDGITITCDGTLTTVTIGDIVSLRPNTAMYNNLVTNPFLWSNTKFYFGTNPTTALAATATEVEQSSTWKVSHEFNNDGGELRSGSFDPSSLARKFGDADATIKKFFDSAVEVNNFLAKKARALVIRHFVYSGTKTYELRVILDQFKYKIGGKPPVESGSLLYHTFDCVPEFNQSTGAGMSVKVINGIAAITAKPSASPSPSTSPSTSASASVSASTSTSSSPSTSPSHSASTSPSI